MTQKNIAIVVEWQDRGVERGLRDTTGSVRRAGQAATEADRSFAGLTQTLQQSGGKLLAVAGAARLAGDAFGALVGATQNLARASLDLGAGFQQALALLGAQSGATARGLEQVREQTLALGRDAGLPATTAKKAADAILELSKGGLSLREAMSGARATLQLAAVASVDVAEAAKITAGAMNAFRLSGSETAAVVDLLAGASTAASGEIRDTAQAMQQAAAIYAGAKRPVSDLVTQIALLARNGIQGSDAGTSLKVMLQRLTAATDDAERVMRRLGVTVFDAQGNLLPTIEIIRRFEAALRGMNDETRAGTLQKIFGDDAMRAAQILFREGVDGYRRMEAAVTRTGLAAELATAKMSGVGGALDKLQSQAETFGLVVFERVAAPLESGVKAAAALFETMANNLGVVGAMTAAVSSFGAALIAANIGTFAGSFGALAQAAAPLVNSLRTVALSMIGVGVAGQSMAAMLTTATLGWGALIAAVVAGGAALAGAFDRPRATLDEQVTALDAAKREADSLAAQMTALGTATGALADRQTALGAIYHSLNQASRARVDMAVAEKGATRALAEEVERLQKAKRLEVEARATEMARQAQEQFAALERARQAERRAVEALQEAQRRGFRDLVIEGARGQAAGVVTAEQQSRALNQEVARTSDAVRQAQEQFDQYRDALSRAAGILGVTADQLVTQKAAARELSQVSPQLVEALRGTSVEQQNIRRAADDANQSLARQIATLKALKDAAQERKSVISDAVVQIAEEARTVEEARRRLRARQREDADFARALSEERRVAANRRALEELTNVDRLEKRAARSAQKQRDEIAETQREVDALARRLDALRRGEGRLFTLQLDKEEQEEALRRLRDILKLRRELGRDAGAPLPGDRRGAEEELRALNRAKSLRDEIARSQREQEQAEDRLTAARARAAQQLVAAQTQFETAYLEGVRRRREAEQELTTSIALEIRRRTDAQLRGDETATAQAAAVRGLFERVAQTRRQLIEQETLAALRAGETAVAANPLLREALALAQRPASAASPVVAELQTLRAEVEAIHVTVREAATAGRSAARAATGAPTSTGNARIDAAVARAAAATGVDANLIVEVMRQESRFRPRAVSPAGAQGLMQLMPGTARLLGVGDPFNIEQSVMGGARYLAQLLERFGGDTALALAGYNAGPGRARRALTRFRETRNYVASILGRYRPFSAAPPPAADAPALVAESSGVGDVILPVGRPTPAPDAAGLLRSAVEEERHLRAAQEALERRERLAEVERQLAELRRGDGAAAARLLADIEESRATNLRDALANARRAEEELAALRGGDPRAVEAARLDADTRITQSQAQAARRIIELQQEIARAGEGAAERMQIAYLESVRARQQAEESAAASILRAQQELADKSAFSQTQYAAALLEYFNRNTKSVTQIAVDARTRVFDAVFAGVDSGVERLTRRLGAFGGVVGGLLKDLARLALNRVFLWLMGGSGGFGGGFGGLGGGFGGLGGGLGAALGGGLGAALGGGGRAMGGSAAAGLPALLGGLFGGRGGFSVPGFAGGMIDVMPTLGDQARRALLIGPGAVGGAAAGLPGQALGGLFGGPAGLKGALGSMAPLLGLGLGAQFGGPLGGVGGTLLGGAAFAALGGFKPLIAAGGLGGSIAGSAAAFLTNPLTIAAGIGLLIGGVFLRRARQRRADERERDRLFGEAEQQLRQLLDDVNRGRTDGRSAVQTARRIRDQYRSAVNSLRTGSVRRSAQQTGRRGEPSQFSRIDALVQEIERAAERQQRRQEIDRRLTPEFALGGSVAAALRGFTGRVPGVYRGPGADDTLIAVQGDEVVLTPRQRRALRLTPEKLAAAGVPGFAGGGWTPSASPPMFARADAPPFGDQPLVVRIERLTLEVGRSDATALVASGLSSSTGQRVQFQMGQAWARGRER